jgi:selenocysteine lyase/cysteine desulfurase
VIVIRLMIERLSGDMPGLTFYGPQGVDHRCGVFSIRIDGFEDPQSLSDVLEHDFGLLTRSGIHCAPLAHQTIGTDQLGGTTRLSFGPYTTEEDVRYTCDSLAHICQNHAARAGSC